MKDGSPVREEIEILKEGRKIPKKIIEELSPSRRFQFARIREDIDIEDIDE